MISSSLARQSDFKGTNNPVSLSHHRSPEYLASVLLTYLYRRIVDDGFEHSLTVLQDRKSGGLRLQAAVRNGDLKKCPVWTAFGKLRVSTFRMFLSMKTFISFLTVSLASKYVS
jgi:hypothetical protein